MKSTSPGEALTSSFAVMSFSFSRHRFSSRSLRQGESKVKTSELEKIWNKRSKKSFFFWFCFVFERGHWTECSGSTGECYHVAWQRSSDLPLTSGRSTGVFFFPFLWVRPTPFRRSAIGVEGIWEEGKRGRPVAELRKMARERWAKRERGGNRNKSGADVKTRGCPEHSDHVNTSQGGNVKFHWQLVFGSTNTAM